MRSKSSPRHMEAVVVARARNGEAQQILILVHGADDGADHEQEARVLAWGLAGGEEVDARIGGEPPVVVLAGAVDSGEGLFVQQAGQPVAARNLFHNLHRELVVVHGDAARLKHGRELVLGGRDLVVLRFGGDAEPPELLVQIAHKLRDAQLDRAVIVVVELLSLRRLRAEKGVTRVNEVLALFITVAVDEEILLFESDRGENLGAVHAEQAHQTHCLRVQRVHGAQERGLLVQRVAAEGAERRRDAGTGTPRC